METQPGTLHSFARHLVSAMEPLKEAVADLPAFRTFLYRLGWEAQSLPTEYTALAAKVDAAMAALNSLGASPQPAQIYDVLGKVKALYEALKEISAAPEGVDPGEFLSDIGHRVFELLLVDYLAKVFPSAHS